MIPSFLLFFSVFFFFLNNTDLHTQLATNPKIKGFPTIDVTAVLALLAAAAAWLQAILSPEDEP